MILVAILVIADTQCDVALKHEKQKEAATIGSQPIKLILSFEINTKLGQETYFFRECLSRCRAKPR